MRRPEKETAADLRLMPKAGNPAETPKWITQELIEKTLSIWQPRYGRTLTAEDAIGMLIDAARLLDALVGMSG